MALIVMPSLLSKRPWARIRARCEASFFIVLSKSVRCCSVRGRTYLTLIALKIGVTCHIALELSREILYQKTFGRALSGGAGWPSQAQKRSAPPIHGRNWRTRHGVDFGRDSGSTTCIYHLVTRTVRPCRSRSHSRTRSD